MPQPRPTFRVMLSRDGRTVRDEEIERIAADTDIRMAEDLETACADMADLAHAKSDDGMCKVTGVITLPARGGASYGTDRITIDMIRGKAHA